ncbi:hypothetical protein LB505_008748 [Fusarium chuoi]|nr:hypothetical protein LB505_008748 [Fusarium chuoi]
MPRLFAFLFGFSPSWLTAMPPANSKLPRTVSASIVQKNTSTILSVTEMELMRGLLINVCEGPSRR